MRWLDDGLVFSPIKFGLCTNAADFEKAQSKIGVAKAHRHSFLQDGCLAITYYFFDAKKPGIIVAVGSRDGRTRSQYHALLVHEAVHVWWAIKDRIGEKNPSEEFEAYALQNISQYLFQEFEANRPQDLESSRDG